MHEFLELVAADITQIAAIIAALLAVVAAMRTVRTRRDLTAVRIEAEEHTVQLDRVEHRWNGRLDELLEVTRQAAYSAGQRDEVRTQLAALQEQLMRTRNMPDGSTDQANH